MAEILGLVSGSITVAETAGAVFKLKRLWNEVRNAPDYIDSLIDQLSLVHHLLTETEAELKEDEQLLTTSNAARLTLKYCKKFLWDLDALAHDLRQQIEAKRRLSRGKAKVKVALEKEVICNLHKRMQDALQLLGIAQQTYIIALTKTQPLLIAQQISPLREATIGFEDKFQKQPEKDPALDVVIRRAVAGNRVDRRPLAWRYSKYLGSYTSHAYKAPDTVYHARIQMPSWLTEKAWDFCVRKASHGWMYSLRQWTIRPISSEVLFAVMNGDISTINRLFEERHASPYDRDPNGWTLLHLAMFYPQRQTIEYLVDKGLDFHEREEAGSTPLDQIMHNIESDATAVVDTLGYLKSTGDLTDALEELFDPDAVYQGKSRLCIFCPLFRIPGLINVFYHEFWQIPLDQWLRSINWCLVDPNVLYDILQAEGAPDPEFVRRQLSNSRSRSLHLFVDSYFDHALISLKKRDLPGRPIDPDFQDWRKLTRWLFRGIKLRDLCVLVDDGWGYTPTPLFTGLVEIPGDLPVSPRVLRQARRGLQQSLTFWLEDLHAAGVNLERYGERETRLLRGDESTGQAQGWDFAAWATFLKGADRPMLAGLASFSFGPEPEDWELVWEEIFVEDFVGEFFSFAEQVPSVPGAWVD